MKINRPISAIIAGVILSSMAAACSSNPSHASGTASTTATGSNPVGSLADRAIVNATSAKTIANRTANLNVTLAVSNGPHATVTGPFNLATGQGQLNLSILGSSVVGGLPNPATLLYAGGNLYLQASGIITSFDGNKPWAQITPTAVQQIFCLTMPGSSTSSLAKLAAGNPASLLHVLDTPDMTVTASSNYPGGLVSGVSYYTVNINAKAASKTATGEAKQFFDDLASTSTSAPITVGINSSGVLRVLSASFKSSGSDVLIQMNLSNFGVAVNVVAPSPSLVGPLNLPGNCVTSSNS
ncbi:MAG TPA: hypothetical protein VMU77_04205 [Acidimicrobiales bacterium]|nr:hypothetical protein [Acidimicrobiales bacterium]